MCATLGLSNLEKLLAQTLPASIRSTEPLTIGASLGEHDMLTHLRQISQRNQVFTSMIGMGYYGTITPSVISRNILENPGWYTAYTPYQAEVAQGRLEALLNFQHMIADLVAMPIANASLLDEATAAAEAMTMMQRVSKKKSNRFLVDTDLHPQTLAVLKTRAEPLGIALSVKDVFTTDLHQEDFTGLIIQNPGTSGQLRDLGPIITTAHSQQGLVAVATDLLACTLITPPGEQMADIVFGSAQRFGVPMGYGGPHAAFFATQERFKRALPGRIIGVSKDRTGNTALRMALQTREQHIRREKATSNICTAQALLAVMAGMYGVYHGPEGLTQIATKIHHMTTILATGLKRFGVSCVHDHFFDTLKLKLPNQASIFAAKARQRRLNLREIDQDHLGIALDETTRRQDLLAVLSCFTEDDIDSQFIDTLDRIVTRTKVTAIPAHFQRQTAFLSHPVFHQHRAETAMMRYMRKLAGRDIALDRAMIPLGSCTMKLNPASALIPITWENFANLHPYAPKEQAEGYHQLFHDLSVMLCDITGYDAISLQPNSGAQGEYAGLLTIRSYHQARGDHQRTLCLVPDSAHGTNPASAKMAGFDVMVVACDAAGNVDHENLRKVCIENQARLAALMVTYPSTHGVFEEHIREICAIIHQYGGQVYLDGANMNAMVGLVKPGKIGADVSHLNLHKTFAIPHGGGGPGMGPIGVGAHLAPYLPSHPLDDNGATVAGSKTHTNQADITGAVSAAAHGSAMILPISWAYCKMLGSDGLKRATEIAILSANYIAKRLENHYPILYRGRNGRVAHECIIDLAAIKKSSGITNEDIAKRLIDYGFHAPTMSFPVMDTLMIEPTESESLAELDRFCVAMIQIRAEIDAIEKGDAARTNNLLVNAPHTHQLLLANDWPYPYSKQAAFFPLGATDHDKFWPPIARVDNVLGDRHLICSCPPIDTYMAAE